MPELTKSPHTPVDAVTEILHGVAVTDPYRWLEDQESARTRAWIAAQTQFARSYLGKLPARERIRERVRELLDGETYDSVQKVGNRYFFRKRKKGQEQASIYMRDGAEGKDELLIDPTERQAGTFTAVKPRLVSPDGQLLLYEIKEGGERTGTFALLDVNSRETLPDILPRGCLRGFAFAPDCKSFYFVHEAPSAERPNYRAAYHHLLGTKASHDREVFFAGDDVKTRLILTSDKNCLAFYIYRFRESTLTDIYLKRFGTNEPPEPLFLEIDYKVSLLMFDDDVLAITDKDAPNRRIVKIRCHDNGHKDWIEIVPESGSRIETALVVRSRIFVSYLKRMVHRVVIFDLSGRSIGEIPTPSDQTVRIIGGSHEGDEILLEAESFTEPARIFRYCPENNGCVLWAKRSCAFNPIDYASSQISYTSKDGTRIPMYLVGRREILEGTGNPTIMTSYGGYGISMTPQFSVFVAFLMERGCLFALPNIRGGAEFGVEWHYAARRRNRQTAYDDFLCAADWLIQTGRTARGRLAIFGGSNSGLLVGAALTQRPDLFCAVVCIAPMMDMLRYHLFDSAHVWKDEFGTADDPDDFAALANYSPYHRVRDGVAYPAAMIISGDSDGNCNPLHSRKMTARLQAANVSGKPIVLDYSRFRGHSPVLPLCERIEALTDRLGFVCNELQLPA